MAAEGVRRAAGAPARRAFRDVGSRRISRPLSTKSTAETPATAMPVQVRGSKTSRDDQRVKAPTTSPASRSVPVRAAARGIRLHATARSPRAGPRRDQTYAEVPRPSRVRSRPRACQVAVSSPLMAPDYGGASRSAAGRTGPALRATMVACAPSSTPASATTTARRPRTWRRRWRRTSGPAAAAWPRSRSSSTRACSCPVVAVLGEVEHDDAGLAHDKSSDMATVLMTSPDGRRGLLAFTCSATMSRWDPAARPVPGGSAAGGPGGAAGRGPTPSWSTSPARCRSRWRGSRWPSLADGLVLTRLRTDAGGRAGRRGAGAGCASTA